MNGSQNDDIMCAECTRCMGHEITWKKIGSNWYCPVCYAKIMGNESHERLKVAREAMECAIFRIQQTQDRGGAIRVLREALARIDVGGTKLEVTDAEVNRARLAFIKTNQPTIDRYDAVAEGSRAKWVIAWTDEQGQSNEEFGSTFEEVLDNARVPEEQVRDVADLR